MKNADEIKRAIKDLHFTTGADLDERICKDASAALERSKTTGLDIKSSSLGIWRKIMKSNWTKLAAAAAVIAIVVGLSITFVGQSATPAYALAQTIEANRGVRYYHIRIEPAGNGIKEAWAQIGEDGELLHLRMEFPNTEDGPKVVVWQEDKAEVWFKANKSAVVVHEKKMVDRLPGMMQMFDPIAAMERLNKAQAEAIVEIETQEPSVAGDPITLIATATQAPFERELYQVNSQTKLIEQIERYRLNDDGQYEWYARHEYLDYNQPIDPEVFTINPPDDVMRIDQTTQVIGLAKGELTDKEIAVKVVREFFEALIAKDYAKAGQLFEGIPAAKMEEMFGKMNVVRIISIGEPEPHPIPGVGGFRVPCKIESEKDGKKCAFEPYGPCVRPVYSQPDRWTIHGGI